MSTLNKLPDGSPSPTYTCKARGHYDGEIKEIQLTEWWNDGKQIETIEQSAEDRFYDVFDKSSFKILSITRN